MLSKPIAATMILLFLFTSWSHGDELGELYHVYSEECIARMKAAQRGELLDPDQKGFTAIWLPRLMDGMETHPNSPYYQAVLREVAGSLAWSGRIPEALPFYEELIDLAPTPQEKAHDMYQMGLTLRRAAYETRLDGLAPREDYDPSFAWEAIAYWEALREYLEAEGLSSSHARLVPESMIYQAGMYEFLEEYPQAARMYVAADKQRQRLSAQDMQDLKSQSGPSGEFLLTHAARDFAKSDEPDEVFPLVDRLADIPDREQPMGGLWSQLIELDVDAYFDAALEWVLGMPDKKESPGTTISRLTFEAKYVRKDHALAYELLTLQLEHYPDNLSEAMLETMQRQQESWLRDMLHAENEPTEGTLPMGEPPDAYEKAAPVDENGGAAQSPMSEPEEITALAEEPKALVSVATSIEPAGDGKLVTEAALDRPAETQAPLPVHKPVSAAEVSAHEQTVEVPASDGADAETAEPRASLGVGWTYAGGMVLVSALIGVVLLRRTKAA